MRKLITILASVGLVAPLGGCLIRTSSRGQPVSRRADCPPAHHWEGGVCVHNGGGVGNGKGQGRGNRR